MWTTSSQVSTAATPKSLPRVSDDSVMDSPSGFGALARNCVTPVRRHSDNIASPSQASKGWFKMFIRPGYSSVPGTSKK